MRENIGDRARGQLDPFPHMCNKNNGVAEWMGKFNAKMMSCGALKPQVGRAWSPIHVIVFSWSSVLGGKHRLSNVNPMSVRKVRSVYSWDMTDLWFIACVAGYVIFLFSTPQPRLALYLNVSSNFIDNLCKLNIVRKGIGFSESGKFYVVSFYVVSIISILVFVFFGIILF